MKLVDYSWARPAPADIAALGYAGALRYVGPGNGGRDLTRPECEALWAAGLGVGLCWETQANRVLDGYEAGCYDASQADFYASMLGAPDDVPIYFAADCDVNPAQTWGVILDYFAGAMQSCHVARAYGEADVLDMCADTYGMRHGWQAGASSWSDWRTSPNASMLQSAYYVMDDQCDENTVLCPTDQVDWLWGGQIDMPLTQGDLNAMRQVMREEINGAMANNYTGSRALKVDGKPEVWELLPYQGDVGRRYIGRPTQQRMLQWADHLAGPRDQAPRVLTDPDDIREFEALPVVGGE